jgi:hypothetical protein
MKDRMVLEVITDVLPECVPQCPWISRSTVLENGDKELMHLMANCHVLCFFKALVPLIVIFCKAIGNAGFSKGRIENTLKDAKVFKRGSTLDNSEKKAQIKVLPSRGMSIIHSAYLKAPIPGSSDIRILMPDHVVRKVLIKDIAGVLILMSSIVLEPSSKSSVSIIMLLKSLLKSFPARIKDYWLMLGKMNCKV